MARVLKGSHSFTPNTPLSSANGMNHTSLCGLAMHQSTMSSIRGVRADPILGLYTFSNVKRTISDAFEIKVRSLTPRYERYHMYTRSLSDSQNPLIHHRVKLLQSLTGSFEVIRKQPPRSKVKGHQNLSASRAHYNQIHTQLLLFLISRFSCFYATDKQAATASVQRLQRRPNYCEVER